MIGNSRLDWVIRFASIFLMTMLSTACASLPEVSNLNTSLVVPTGPTVTNGQGTLSKKTSDSLLAKRWHNSHIDIAALAELEEAATGNPLSTGNKITLLYDGPQTM